MLESFVQDARHAVRGFARGPVFALTAILSLAIGVGATTAIFSLVNALLLSPPPGIGEPDRLVSVGRTNDGSGFDNMSYPNYVDYRGGTRTLSGLAAMQYSPRALSLAGPDGGEAVEGSIVSGNFFDVLQVRPALGRFFLAEEDRTPRSHPVVVLSHSFWRDRFESDSSIIGRGIVLNGSSFTVVGVAAEGFRGPVVLAPDLWAPVMAAPLLGMQDGMLTGRRNVWLMAIGRLAPDAGVTQAQAELSTIASRLAQSYPESNLTQGVAVMPMSLFPGDFQGVVNAFMFFLFALSGLVLLVAGTNVAGMLLARAAARRREIAVRLAIGASRGRLLRQLLTESVLLFLIAGALGVLLARWLLTGLMALVPRLPMQLAIDPQIDVRALSFALAVSLVAGILAGLAPALQSTRPSLVPGLRGEGNGSRLRLRSGLLVAQMAFSMLLLVVGGLFGRALVQARSIDPGFDPRGVQIATLDFRLTNHDSTSGRQFADALLERTRTIPGVQMAALARMIPLDGGSFGLGGIAVAGRESMREDGRWEADWNIVTPDYFDVMRIPLVAGRSFSDADRTGAPDVAIINQTLANLIWDGDAVGQTFTNGERIVTVIGIARDAKYRTLGEPARGFIYVPLAQRYFAEMSLLVRGEPGAALAAPIRNVVADLDPALPILVSETMEEHTAIGLFPQRIALVVAASLGLVALLLSVLGIYGVTAYGVARRTREIGIRLALGSPRERVLGLVLRQGMVLAGAGVGIGLLMTLGVARLLESLLFGVPGTDMVALGGAALLLVLAALVASWVPALRASRVDPAVALRSD
ncbi:MAG TPA: ABC transporter permease [Longimicrobiales bacterium]|nr:ABC transporter permease [Longimicrobiales bacterium]